MQKKRWTNCILLALSVSLLTGCGGSDVPSAKTPPSATTTQSKESQTPETQQTVVRDTTPYCPMPEASGEIVCGNDVTTIDASHTEDGYIMVNYTGTCPKVKLIITGPNDYKCTYDIKSSDFSAFPLTSGNGSYSVGVYENIQDTQYSTCYTTVIEATNIGEFAPYLRPNQYCYYEESFDTVALAKEICQYSETDLDLVTCVYDYITQNISYDQDKAVAASSGSLTGYISDIDTSLSDKKGICLDYAAMMTCMLRTQQIPTRLEVGYAGSTYHAWISVYLEDIGWVNGIIEFTGSGWSLMDPTFGASTGSKELREFIGDGTNYTTKYIY